MTDDGALVRACQRGDENAWEALIRRYRRLIYSIPVAYRLKPEQADDVFQTVALRLLEHLHRLRRKESIASWIAVTTRRECLALLRGARRWSGVEEGTLESISEDPPDVAEILHAVECERALTLAFERLGEPCRSLLSALYIEEPTPDYQEISRRLGRPIGSLGPTRARCLAKLQSLYSQSGGKKP